MLQFDFYLLTHLAVIICGAKMYISAKPNGLTLSIFQCQICLIQQHIIISSTLFFFLESLAFFCHSFSSVLQEFVPPEKHSFLFLSTHDNTMCEKWLHSWLHLTLHGLSLTKHVGRGPGSSLPTSDIFSQNSLCDAASFSFLFLSKTKGCQIAHHMFLLTLI